jgi:hypothetical protein
VAVPDAVFLFAVRGADAGIHVEQDASRRPACMYAVNPLAGQWSAPLGADSFRPRV